MCPVCIALPLIPDGSFYRELQKGMNHGVVQYGGPVGASTRCGCWGDIFEVQAYLILPFSIQGKTRSAFRNKRNHFLIAINPTTTGTIKDPDYQCKRSCLYFICRNGITPWFIIALRLPYFFTIEKCNVIIVNGPQVNGQLFALPGLWNGNVFSKPDYSIKSRHSRLFPFCWQ
ncbi:hypothetical protein D3C86_1642510 [compost metagenome]